MNATDTAETEHMLYLKLKSKYEAEYASNLEYVDNIKLEKPVKKNRQDVAPKIRNKGGRIW